MYNFLTLQSIETFKTAICSQINRLVALYAIIIDLAMFGSFTNMLNKLKTTKIAQNIADNYHKITESVKKPLNITQITAQLFHIDYPVNQNYATLKEHIGQREFQIWNISEYPYDKQLQAKILQTQEQGELHHLCFQYYSNLPLYELILALNSIHAFLSLSPNNRVYVHCQDNKMRSGVFLGCYLYKFHVNQIQDLSEAIIFINKKLSTSLQGGSAGEGSSAKYNNLHVFFKNFINFLNNPQIVNKNQLELLKIIVNQAPKLQLSKQMLIAGGSSKELKVGLQIRCKQQIIFKGVYQSSVFAGDSLCLQLNKKTLTLSDDFLVMLKYIYKGKIYNIVRMQLNTNFIYDRFYRTHKQYIDLSAYCVVSNPAAMFIDFMFQQTNSLSNLANLDPLLPNSFLKVKNRQNPSKQIEKKQEKQVVAQEVSVMNNFSLQEHDQEHHQIDEGEISRKIEEVIKNINKRQPDEEQEEPAEEDLDDYLTKLQSQI